jgi:hypothetical protein
MNVEVIVGLRTSYAVDILASTDWKHPHANLMR